MIRFESKAFLNFRKLTFFNNFEHFLLERESRQERGLNLLGSEAPVPIAGGIGETFRSFRHERRRIYRPGRDAPIL